MLLRHVYSLSENRWPTASYRLWFDGRWIFQSRILKSEKKNPNSCFIQKTNITINFTLPPKLADNYVITSTS